MATISSVTSADMQCPGDQTRTCKSLIVTMSLSKHDRIVDSTILSFTDVDSSTVVLNNTVRIKANLEDMTVRLPLAKRRTVYNTYEEFEPGAGCSISFKVGKCASMENLPVLDPRTQETDPTADRFVLCCIGNSPRRLVGGHCLRSNRDDVYEEYRNAVPPIAMNSVKVNVIQKGTVHRFPINSLSPKQTEADFGEVYFLENFDAFPDLYRFHPSANQYAFFRDMRKSNPARRQIKNIDNWIYANLISERDQYERIGIDAVQWASAVTCSQPLHYNTRTHSSDKLVEDQFFEWRSQTVRQLMMDADVTNRTDTLQVDTTGDSDSYDQVAIRFERDPAQVTLILTIYDVLS